MSLRTLALALVAVLGATPAPAAPISFTRIAPDAYQSFIGSWSPADAPLCAAISSADEWSAVFHPAPVMGAQRPFAPDPSFWTAHMILLVARVEPSGGAAFSKPSVSVSDGAVSVRYAYRPPPGAAFTVKDFLALSVPAASPNEVTWIENGRAVCTLHPAAGAWLSPPRS
jgi:hypothetical protein